MKNSTLKAVIIVGFVVGGMTIFFPVYLPLSTWWDYVAAFTIPACLLAIIIGMFVVPLLRKKR